MVSNLLTSNVRSLQENLKPRPCFIDRAIFREEATGMSALAGFRAGSPFWSN